MEANEARPRQVIVLLPDGPDTMPEVVVQSREIIAQHGLAGA
jgi:hypothetical protein